MGRGKKSVEPKPSKSAAGLGFEEKLWAAADKLRGHMDAAEYKHVALGLIFLKYISDAFQKQYEKIATDPLANPEDRDEYTAENIFWVPAAARWMHLQNHAKQPTIGKLIDEAMVEIEKENPSLKGCYLKTMPALLLTKMNLAIRGIDGNIGPQNADSFHNDLHKDLKADFILANPPFNMSDWGGDRLREDGRWKHGTPHVGNANYGWVQHMIHHLAPNGIAGFVLANGSMSSNQSGEGEIRRSIVEADLVDCMIALPGQLFYNTQIPACLWFLARNKNKSKFRDRSRETLFIDARKRGILIDRVHRELTDQEITWIAQTYHAWRGEKEAGEYEDIPGFCKSANLDEIAAHAYVLTPGRYVRAEEIEDDDEAFEEKMQQLVMKLEEQFKESARLEKEIRLNLRELGYGD